MVERLHKHLGQIGSKFWFPRHPLTYNGGNVIPRIVTSFLIGSWSNLPITRTVIKSWMSSILGQIGPFSWSYSPLSDENFSQNLQWRKCRENSALTFNWIIFKLAGNRDSKKISEGFKFRPDRTSHLEVTCAWVPKDIHSFKLECLGAKLGILDQILYVASLVWRKSCIRFLRRLDQNWFPWQPIAPIDL